MRDKEARDHVQQPARKPSCGGEGSHCPPMPGEAAPGHPRWAPAGRRERKRASFSRAWQLQSAKVEAALSLHRPARQPVATLIRERPEMAQTLSQFTNWFGRNNKPVPCVDPRLQLFAGLYDVVMHINYQRYVVRERGRTPKIIVTELKAIGLLVYDTVAI